jgi:bla regulator protein blaR1
MGRWKKLMVYISVGVLLSLLAVAHVAIPALSAQSPDVPDWQTAAGGKMTFDVASVKPSKVFKPPSFDLSTGNSVAPGGRFLAVFPLWIYIAFAYKFQPTENQTRAALAQLPKWVNTDLFEIEARADGNPTKDQMRLMMQSLLADRFELVVHFESREVPVLALTLDRPGKLGPKLRPHSQGPACPEFKAFDPASFPAPPKAGDVFPPVCDTLRMSGRPGGLVVVGSRNTTMQYLAEGVQVNGSMAGEIDKPVVDKTGLNGTFDYTIEYSGRLPGPLPPAGVDAPPSPETTFLQSLRQQLGLKLVPSRAPVRTIVIDHVERPSEN